MFDRNQKRDNRSTTTTNNDRRPSLNWKEVKKLQRGSTIGTINKAELEDESIIYSWCIGKEGRGQREGQVLKFCDPRDIQDAHDVLDDIEDWVEDDRATKQ